MKTVDEFLLNQQEFPASILIGIERNWVSWELNNEIVSNYVHVGVTEACIVTWIPHGSRLTCGKAFFRAVSAWVDFSRKPGADSKARRRIRDQRTRSFPRDWQFQVLNLSLVHLEEKWKLNRRLAIGAALGRSWLRWFAFENDRNFAEFVICLLFPKVQYEVCGLWAFMRTFSDCGQ